MTPLWGQFWKKIGILACMVLCSPIPFHHSSAFFSFSFDLCSVLNYVSDHGAVQEPGSAGGKESTAECCSYICDHPPSFFSFPPMPPLPQSFPSLLSAPSQGFCFTFTIDHPSSRVRNPCGIGTGNGSPFIGRYLVPLVGQRV